MNYSQLQSQIQREQLEEKKLIERNLSIKDNNPNQGLKKSSSQKCFRINKQNTRYSQYDRKSINSSLELRRSLIQRSSSQGERLNQKTEILKKSENLINIQQECQVGGNENQNYYLNVDQNQQKSRTGQGQSFSNSLNQLKAGVSNSNTFYQNQLNSVQNSRSSINLEKDQQQLITKTKQKDIFKIKKAKNQELRQISQIFRINQEKFNVDEKQHKSTHVKEELENQNGLKYQNLNQQQDLEQIGNEIQDKNYIVKEDEEEDNQVFQQYPKSLKNSRQQEKRQIQFEQKQKLGNLKIRKMNQTFRENFKKKIENQFVNLEEENKNTSQFLDLEIKENFSLAKENNLKRKKQVILNLLSSTKFTLAERKYIFLQLVKESDPQQNKFDPDQIEIYNYLLSNQLHFFPSRGMDYYLLSNSPPNQEHLNVFSNQNFNNNHLQNLKTPLSPKSIILSQHQNNLNKDKLTPSQMYYHKRNLISCLNPSNYVE